MCATHLAEFGIGRLPAARPAAKLKVDRHRPLSASEFARRRRHRGDRVCSDPQGGVYKSWSSRATNWSAPACTATHVDGSWYFKLLRRPQRRRHPRPPDVRREQHRRRDRPRGPQQGRPRWPIPTRSAAAAASPRERSAKAIKEKGLFTSKTGCASAHQRPARAAAVHGPGRAAADVHGRRRLFECPQEEGLVRLHGPAIRTARGHPHQQLLTSVDSMKTARLAHAQWLRLDAARRSTTT